MDSIESRNKKRKDEEPNDIIDELVSNFNLNRSSKRKILKWASEVNIETSFKNKKITIRTNTISICY